MLTWNVRSAVPPLPSLTVTVTSAEPVVPSGAESIRTPFSSSKKTSTDCITTSTSGLDELSVATFWIAWRTASPSTRKPKTEWLKSRWRVALPVMKNCESFVSSLLLAIDSTPALV